MNRLKGIVMITIGAMLWGVTGPILEWLLKETPLNVTLILAIRLVMAGVFLLGLLKVQKVDIWAIWRETIWRRQLLIFSVVGMLGLQYTFVYAIQASNAVVATLLQFLAPIFIIFYTSMRLKKWPPKAQVIGIIGTLFGLFLLLTNGSITSLVVSEKALLWGVLLGLTYAFYTLYPVRLMKECGVLPVVAWGMLLNGLYSAVIGRIWASDQWVLLQDAQIMWLIVALSVFGALAFILFLSSLHYISAVETSVLSSLEPVTALLFSAVWLGATLQMWQFVGFACMIVFITYVSIAGDKQEVVEQKTTQTV